jgi:CRP-like cAMP-binding protein
VAIGDVDATVSSSATLTRALEDAAAARGLVLILAARLRDADRTRIQFATLDTLGRVADRLLELSERFGQDTGDGIVVELPLSQEQLASWCGASRESTVKALSTLRSLNCITTGRQSLVIHDLNALGVHARRRPSG